MARKESQAYDVRALYGGGLTWVVRHHSLLGALWYLWRSLRGRTYRAPGYPAEVLRYELVRVPEPYISGWDPVRQSIHLRPEEEAWPRGAPLSLQLEEERWERVQAALQAAEGLQDADLLEAGANIRNDLLDGSPYVPQYADPRTVLRRVGSIKGP